VRSSLLSTNIHACTAVPVCPVYLLLSQRPETADQRHSGQALSATAHVPALLVLAEETGATAHAGPNVSAALREGGLANAALAVWTTTPWTMPANLAVAVNDRMDYSLVQARDPNPCAISKPDLNLDLFKRCD